MTDDKYVSWDLKQPGISFCLTEGRITLFKTTMDVLGNPEFYQFLFSPEDRLFAVQTCGISDKGANRVRIELRSDNYSVKTMDLVRFVYQSCRWKENVTYRVPGVAYPADRAVQFDLAAAYEIHEGRVMEPAPRLPVQ